MANYSEIQLNNKTLLSTAEDTVTSQSLAKGTTATDSAGEKVEGEVEIITREEINILEERVDDLEERTSEILGTVDNTLYSIDDEESSEIDNEDYIPFYDNSEQEKKNTLLSTIINKIKSAFLPKTWGHVELVQNTETLAIYDNEVDATASDNDVTANHYPSSNDIRDKNGKIIARNEAIVFPNGTVTAKMYAQNYDTSGNSVGQNAINVSVDKSGTMSYSVSDKNAFRKAIGTIDQDGTVIPSNSDLNDYTTAGTYYVNTNAIASTVSNMPVAYSGKLVVMYITDSNPSIIGWKAQIFIPNHESALYIRSTDSNTAWLSWKEVTAPHTYEVGTLIQANDDLDDYISEGSYTIHSDSVAQTISNIPVVSQGKLIVYRVNNGDNRAQLFITSLPHGIYERVRYSNGTWTEWKQFATTDDITPANVGNGYAEATVSGSAITATITGFKLRAGVIVALKITTTISSACTLNINNTGAKTVTFWDNQNPSIGKPINYGINLFMYDGTYYRRIGMDRTPYVGVQDYVADTSGNELIEWGYGSNKVQLKHSIGSNKLRWNYYKNSAWRGDVNIADYDDLGASIAKVGKSILPIWNETTNVITRNGITFTFNPSTGETTANGTATADAWCQLFSGKLSTTKIALPKGSYVLSGCPSGGSDSKYFLVLYAENSAWRDYGSGNTFTLSDDSLLDNDFSICIKSGQTVSNLVFKPMLRPAFTTADFEPCEDIHKGNCYVGTCTTAGDTKDKVAYVDGYFVLRKGVRIAIKFSNTNTYSNVTSSPITLNVNDTGAKNIWYHTTHSGAGNTGTNNKIYGVANRYHFYMYDGTYWVWDSVGIDDNSTYSNQSLGNGYGTCATAEATVAKVVTLSGYNLTINGYVSVKFTYAVPANATMNINSKGAKNIWYRGANITANVIKAGDLATFIYDGTRYQLVGVDRDSEQTLISTSNCTPTTKLPTVGTGYMVDGHVLDGHILFLKLEHRFKPTENVTFTGSEAVYTISNVKLGGSYFLWHDVQAYLNYSTLRPMGLYNNGNNLEIRFRGTMPTFNEGSDNTLRITFVTYVDLV